jgi:hypothetical protein
MWEFRRIEGMVTSGMFRGERKIITPVFLLFSSCFSFRVYLTEFDTFGCIPAFFGFIHNAGDVRPCTFMLIVEVAGT